MSAVHAKTRSGPWEAELAERFPGFLLPSSAQRAITPEVAARFLARVSGRPDALAVLRRVSLFSARLAALRRFALASLPALVRTLPSRSEVQRREWEGGFHGRLDLPATLALHRAGQETRFVTRSRVRCFDLPENLLVRAVAERLLAELDGLGRVYGAGSWLGPGLEAAEGLRHLLASTILREIPRRPVDGVGLRAAGMARHPAYAEAAAWHERLRQAREGMTPEATARLLAEGALWPVEPQTRFELAVLLRLLVGLEAHLERREPGRWRSERRLILQGADEVAVLRRDDGASLTLWHNRGVLPDGPRLEGLRRYFGKASSQRPDLVLRIQPPGGRARCVVFEVKLAGSVDYARSGYVEAIAYRHEYAASVEGGWPMAVLVTNQPVLAPPRRDDEVIAVSWGDWAPEAVLEGLTEGLS